MSAQHDRRQFGRRESTIHAVALVGGRAPAHCVVRNFSEKGALLEFNNRFEPPFRFRLVIDSKDVDLVCEVRHQGSHGVGVHFVGGSSAGLFDTQEKAAPAPGQVAPRAAAAAPRASGAELRSTLFGVGQKQVSVEPTRVIEGGSVGVIRGM